MKKVKVLLTIVAILIGVVGCTNTTEDELCIPEFDIAEGMGAFLGIDEETDYSHIVAYTDSAKYECGVETITVMIRNDNPGRGFYYYSVPVLQIQVDEGVWKTVEQNNPRIAEWLFCGVEGNVSNPNECCVMIKSSYFDNALKKVNIVLLFLRKIQLCLRNFQLSDFVRRIYEKIFKYDRNSFTAVDLCMQCCCGRK